MKRRRSQLGSIIYVCLMGGKQAVVIRMIAKRKGKERQGKKKPSLNDAMGTMTQTRERSEVVPLLLFTPPPPSVEG